MDGVALHAIAEIDSLAECDFFVGRLDSVSVYIRIHTHIYIYVYIDSVLSGRGTTRAEDAQGTPTQSHISPSILVYEDKYPGPSLVSQLSLESQLSFEILGELA